MKKFIMNVLDVLGFMFLFAVGALLVHKLFTDSWNMLRCLAMAVPVALSIYMFVPRGRPADPPKTTS